MKNIRLAFRSLFKKGSYNLIKIFTLAIGLSVGLVLIAKVYFEHSYDNFYPDKERIYKVYESTIMENKLQEWPVISGGTVIGIKEETPEVEVATRFTTIVADGVFQTQDKKTYRATTILADSCLFDIFPRKIYSGNPKKVLSQPLYAMVSRSIAQKIGGDVVGKTFSLQTFPGPVITIGGVFEDLPENSSNKYDIIVSMPSIGNFIWDGSMNWLGNERYYGYIKLYPGGRPEKVTEGIERMKTKYLPQEEMKKAEVDIWYPFYPIEELHRNSPEVKRMNAMLILLAFALIVTAVMNYLLIVVSAIMNRSKEIAVHKCYGAGSREIRRMALTESFIHLLLALLISMLLLLIFRDKVSELLGVSLKALFVSEGAILLTGICIAVFLLTGILSGYLYTRIPVATVFRNHKENRRLWKLGLLSIQFVAVGFLGSLLLVIGRQYSDMMHDEPGYSAENVIYIPLEGVDSGLRQRIAEELAALPEIEQVSSCSQLPFQHIAGNNIYLPETSKELFNGADFYNTGTDFLKMMKIPIIAGSNFSAESHTGKQVMVDRNFAEKMKTVAGWTDGVIGKNICITEHSQSNESYTICGVYENIRLGSIADQDNRPSFMFYRKAPSSKVIVKLKNQTPAAMLQIESQIRQLLPDREIPVYSWQAELQNLYTDSRHFRDAVMIGSIVTLLIALIGLIGYTNDELNRRRKEIAIRKVNGGSAGRILKLFLKEILTIAIPSLLTGAGSAAIVARHWQEQFSEKTPLSWYLFVSTILTALLIILAVMSWRVYRETNDNPIKALKSE